MHLHAGERFGRGESPPGGANILLDIRPGANDLRPHRGRRSTGPSFVPPNTPFFALGVAFAPTGPLGAA